MVEDKPYNPYPAYDNSDHPQQQSKTGILYAWKSRASQYISEKDLLKTYQSVDENKVHWTWSEILWDPVGTLIGREIITQEEIDKRHKWKDKEEMAIAIKKNSDYNLIMPLHEYAGSNERHSDTLEKQITHTRILQNWKHFMEVEGEELFERRTVFDMNYLLHQATGGWYKYEPYKQRASVPFRKEGIIAGEMRKEKPLRGPNIRGRYARDLRGDKDVLYEFTNTSDHSHLGSDLGNGYDNEKGMLVIRNKFMNKEDLD